MLHTLCLATYVNLYALRREPCSLYLSFVRNARELRLAYVWRLTVGCTLSLMSTTVHASKILKAHVVRVCLADFVSRAWSPCFTPPGALLAPQWPRTTMCVSLFAAVLGVVSTKRVALVTGANKGIGKEVARLLGALPDHAVVLGCRNEQLGVAAAAELQVQLVNQGRRALHVGLPLTDTTPFRHRRKGATPPTAGWT